MLEDFRNHDPTPTAQEREWISTDPFAAAARVVVLIVVSIAIGGYASVWSDTAPVPTIAKADK